MIRRSALIVAALSVVASLGAGSAARAAGPVVIGGPGSFLTPTYTTPVVPVQVGGELTYVHADVQLHNVEARIDFLPADSDAEWCVLFEIGKCPIFWSPLIGLPQTTAPVRGLENLEAGKVYEFTCSIHPAMIGRVIALPSA